MNQHETLRPCHNYLVRDPVSGQPLAKKGEKKKICSHWLRRLDAGDVEIVPAKKSGAK